MLDYHVSLHWELNLRMDKYYLELEVVKHTTFVRNTSAVPEVDVETA